MIKKSLDFKVVNFHPCIDNLKKNKGFEVLKFRSCIIFKKKIEF